MTKGHGRKRKFPDPSILLCPNVPKPLHGLKPSEILGRSWWDKKRKKAYARFDRKCWACGDHHPEASGLEAHEMYDYDYRAGKGELREIVALCRDCHSFIHNGRLLMIVDEGRITQSQYDRVMDRGVRIVEKHRLYEKWLTRHDVGSSVQQDWAKWHLVIEGKKYYSRFGDYQDWEDHYDSRRIDSISGKVTCGSTNIGANNLCIWVVERNTRGLVELKEYKRVGKRKLENGFAYSVWPIPPGEYLVQATKRAPGRDLKGQTTVTVAEGKGTRDVDIELVDPRSRRKKGRREARLKQSKPKG